MGGGQSRALDAVYPIIYLDAIVVKVRSDHVVVNKACHIAMGVDVDGRKYLADPRRVTPFGRSTASDIPPTDGARRVAAPELRSLQ